MSVHVYHEIYLHLNWHVKDDRPWLTPEVEPVAHKLIAERRRKAKGVYLHAINGTADHVHANTIFLRCTWSAGKRPARQVQNRGT